MASHLNIASTHFPKVTIIIVNWNSGQDILACLSSLRGSSYLNYEIIVVDNGSTDSSLERIRSRFPHVIVIANRDNLGFGEASNVGIKYSLNRGSKYFLVLNPDTVVDKHFIKELVKLAETDTRIGIVGPKVCFHHEPNMIQYTGGSIDLTSGRLKAIGLGKRDHGRNDRAKEVDFVSGCALMLRREIAQQGELFDGMYFHGAEDIDLCIRIRTKLFKIMFTPKAMVWHKLATSSGGYNSPLYVYYQTRNRLLLMKRHGKRGWKVVFPLVFVLSNLKRVRDLITNGNYKSCLSILLGILDFLRNRVGKVNYFDADSRHNNKCGRTR